MALIEKLLEQIFGCAHRFKPEDVHDLNSEPKCIKCNVYYTIIIQNRPPHRFVLTKNNLYKLKRLG